MPEPGSGWKLLDGVTFREVTYVPIMEPPVITAAAYLATLAYPDDLDDRDKFIEAAKSYGVYWARKSGRRDFKARMRPRDMVRRWQRTEKRIEERMLADDAARMLLMARISKGTFVRVPGMRNLRHATGYVLRREGIELPEGWHGDDTATDHKFKNFVARVWAPSKPVLQLAWGLYPEVVGKTYRLDQLVFNPAWVLKSGTPTRVLALTRAKIVTPEEMIILRAAGPAFGIPSTTCVRGYRAAPSASTGPIKQPDELGDRLDRSFQFERRGSPRLRIVARCPRKQGSGRGAQ